MIRKVILPMINSYLISDAGWLYPLHLIIMSKVYIMEVSSDLFSQAATLMLVGMLFVFAFLSLTILVIKNVIAPLAERFPDPVPATRSTRTSQTTSSTDKQQDESVVAAISAAVTQYRRDKS